MPRLEEFLAESTPDPAIDPSPSRRIMKDYPPPPRLLCLYVTIQGITIRPTKTDAPRPGLAAGKTLGIPSKQGHRAVKS